MIDGWGSSESELEDNGHSCQMAFFEIGIFLMMKLESESVAELADLGLGPW